MSLRIVARLHQARPELVSIFRAKYESCLDACEETGSWTPERTGAIQMYCVNKQEKRESTGEKRLLYRGQASCCDAWLIS